MRLNLTATDDRIEGLMADIDLLLEDKPRGYMREVKALEKEVHFLHEVRSRGVEFGTGYYEYKKVNKLGRVLLQIVMFFLFGLLLTMWALSLIN